MDRLFEWFSRVCDCTADCWSVTVVQLFLPRGVVAADAVMDAYRAAVACALAVAEPISVQLVRRDRDKKGGEGEGGSKEGSKEGGEGGSGGGGDYAEGAVAFVEFATQRLACRAAAEMDGSAFGRHQLFCQAGIFPLRLYRRRRMDAAMAVWPARLPPYLREALSPPQSAAAAPRARGAGARALHLLDLLDEGDLDDEEELEEIVCDAESAAEQFGAVVSARVVRLEEGLSMAIAFEEGSSAAAAARSLHGRVFGGRPVRAMLHGGGGTPGREAELFSWDAQLAEPGAPAAREAGGVPEMPERAPLFRTVCVLDMVRADEVQDAEEYEEILMDLADLAARFCSLTHAPAVSIGAAASEGAGDAFVPAWITFDTPAEAHAAAAGLDGMVFAGVPIRAAAVAAEDGADGADGGADGPDGQAGAAGLVEGPGGIAPAAAAAEPEAGARRVVLRGLVRSADVEDEEEREEVLGDLREIAERHGAVEQLRLAEAPAAGSDDVPVTIAYAAAACARAAAAALDGSVFGGSSIRASLGNGDPPAHQSAGPQDTPADPAGPAAQPPPGGADPLDLVLGPDELRRLAAPLRWAEAIAGGAPVVLPPARAGAAAAGGPAPSGAREAVDARVAAATPRRFATNRMVPNLLKGASGGASAYAPPAEVDAAFAAKAKQLLRLLSQMQERARQSGNELKARRGRRLVCGLKEVGKHLPRGKVKLLVLAVNIDSGGQDNALRDEIERLIGLAQDHGVPMTYAMSKRQLGKAVGKTIKVSAVAVVNEDGANELFREVLAGA